MKTTLLRSALVCCGMAAFTFACEEDAMVEPMNNPSSPSSSLSSAALSDDAPAFGTFNPEAARTLTGNLADGYLPNAIQTAVTPSECGLTEFDYVLNSYYTQLNANERGWYSTLSNIAGYTPYFYQDEEPYFGTDGQLTNFAAKHYRNLESFWNMPDEIYLWGQHANQLQNREVLFELLQMLYGLNEASANYYTELFYGMLTNPEGTIGTSPLMAMAGYASSNNVIVIGDGIVSTLSETGLDNKLVFSGILAHEWGHQVQFNNYSNWYAGTAPSPEFTRLKELEADFFTAYYLTHKRGGTYNWKRVEQFLDVFYNIGDCSFTSDGHHGTPLQRTNAAYAGYQLADQTWPKGKILTEQEVHQAFLNSLDEIIANEVM